MQNFDACLKPLLEHEGGNDDDPQDPGGRTSRGIVQSEYNKYRKRHRQETRDVWSASDAEVKDIYKTEYWDVLRCDELPAGVDYCVFDYGVNSGIGRAANVLQKVVGVNMDGSIGAATVNAVKGKDAKSVITAISSERLAFLQRLHTWPSFGRGWERRVNEVKALSLKMAGAGPSRVPEATAGGAVVAAGGAAHAAGLSPLMVGIVVAAAIMVAVAAIVIWRGRK